MLIPGAGLSNTLASIDTARIVIVTAEELEQLKSTAKNKVPKTSRGPICWFSMMRSLQESSDKLAVKHIREPWEEEARSDR